MSHPAQVAWALSASLHWLYQWLWVFEARGEEGALKGR